MDVWGRIFRDHLKGQRLPHFIERDDGQVHAFESAAVYFDAPRSDAERELLDELHGPVLDLGCGPGSYALYLQQRGLVVTAADASPGAIEVCLARGCRNARVMDTRALALSPGSYRGIIIMGNTLGIHQTAETLPALLRTLRRAAIDDATLVCATIDPLETDDPAHLEYHRRNRDRGLPVGLVTIRLRYRDLVDDWAQLWLPTNEELAAAFADTEWMLARRHLVGPFRVDAYTAI